MKTKTTRFTCCKCKCVKETSDSPLSRDWTILVSEIRHYEWPICPDCATLHYSIAEIMASYPTGQGRQQIQVTTCDGTGCKNVWKSELNNQQIGTGPNTPGWLHLTRTPTGVMDHINTRLNMGDGWDFCSTRCCWEMLHRIKAE